MFSSIKCGIKKIYNDFQTDFSIIYQPVDIPCVKIETYEKLIDFYYKNSFDMVKPSFEMKGGHPVVFSSNVFNDLIKDKNLRNYKNLKDYLKENVRKVGYFNTQDSNVLKDFDYNIDLPKK